MAHACFSWTATCALDWDGVGAIATALAAAVAVGLPFFIEYRQKEGERADRKEIIRDLCSSVDQLEAYHEVAGRLLASELVYQPQFKACERIHEAADDLARVLEILLLRPELSDGAIAAGAGAERVAASIVEALDDPYYVVGNVLERRRDILGKALNAARLSARRSTAVREHFRLRPSTAAAAIRAKYLAVIDGCTLAQQTNQPPPEIDLEATPY